VLVAPRRPEPEALRVLADELPAAWVRSAEARGAMDALRALALALAAVEVSRSPREIRAPRATPALRAPRATPALPPAALGSRALSCPPRAPREPPAQPWLPAELSRLVPRVAPAPP